MRTAIRNYLFRVSCVEKCVSTDLETIISDRTDRESVILTLDFTEY